MAVASPALAGVERHQTQTGKLTVEVSTGYVHTFDVAVNPCDGSFTGTEFSAQLDANETIKGSLIDGAALLRGRVHRRVEPPRLQVVPTSPGATDTWIPAGDSFFGVFAVKSSGLSDVTTSTWKNHGEYVSAQPEADREAASESCIGKPIK